MKPNSIWQNLFKLTCTFLLVFLSPTFGRAEEYLLQPGDILSFKIIGPVELEQTVPIEMDGTAWFPIIGEVQAAETTLRQIRERVADAYSVTSFPVTLGTENLPQLILSSQVYVGISSYRPIYIAGDLPTPLIIDFQPGMTLRKAVVLASVGSSTSSTAIIVMEQEEAQMLNLARAYARIWSLKTLLGTDTPQDYENIFVTDSDQIKQIVELERSLISARTEDFERQKRTVANNIKRARMRLAALIKQKANEEEGLRLDEEAVADLRALAVKGLAVSARVAETRRAAISSAGSVLQLDTTIEEVRTELAFLQAEAESIQSSAQSQAWTELSEVIGDVHTRRADMASLRATNAASTLTRSRVMAVITRRGKKSLPIDMASADQHLYPGDLVEILITSSVSQ